jgi:hypothetical protein
VPLGCARRNVARTPSCREGSCVVVVIGLYTTITSRLVVAFAATALALVLTLRLHQTTGAVTLAEDPAATAPPAKPEAAAE